MPVRRPVCLICLIFLFIVYVATGGRSPKPSWNTSGASGKTVTVSGTVTDRQEKNGTFQIFLKNVSYTISDKNHPDQAYFPQRSKGIVVKLADAAQEKGIVKIGQRLEARGVFAPFEAPRCEGMFDAASYYMIRGYEGQIKRARITAVSAGYDRITETLRKVRDRAFDILRDNMSEEDAGLVAAMTLGDKTGLDTEIKELYQNAGISHVLALSGLHIASVGLAVFAFLKRMRLSECASSVISFVLILTYAVMTGLSTSTQRAMIMFGLFVMSRLFGRTYDLLSAAALSALIILAVNPCYVYDAGFLLSFGAVLGIACVFPMLLRVVALLPERIEKGRIFSKVSQGIAVSLSVTVATFPVMGNSFMQISVYSVVINLIVIPLMGFVLLTGSAGIIVGFCGLKPGPILRITHYILWLFEHLGKIFEKIRGNILLIGKPEKWQIITYAIIAISAVVASDFENAKKYLITHREKNVDRTGRHFLTKTASYDKKSENKITYTIERLSEQRKKNRKKSAKTIITAVMIIPAAAVMMFHPRKDLEIRNIDVGQGDCALILGNDIPAVMIDGGSSDIKDVAKNRIMPALKANRVPYIGYCFLTHMDSDHVNGVIGILENETCGIGIENIVVSNSSLRDGSDNENVSALLAAAKKRNTKVITMSAGDELRFGDTRIVCLSPEEKTLSGHLSGSLNTDENDNSLVLRLECGDFSALFTGDIGEEIEREIAKRIENCDYLKVSHHGSRNSSSDDFLKRADPKMCVISAGVDNSYGHPHKETLERIKRTGGRIYTTAETGEVITVLEDGVVKVRCFISNDMK